MPLCPYTWQNMLLPTTEMMESCFSPKSCLCNHFVQINGHRMSFPFCIDRPLLCTSLLLKCHRYWDLSRATSWYREMRQVDTISSDLRGSDNLNTAGVQWPGKLPDEILQQLLSHGASLGISFATNTCLFACLVSWWSLDGIWEHPLSLIDRSIS